MLVLILIQFQFLMLEERVPITLFLIAHFQKIKMLSQILEKYVLIYTRRIKYLQLLNIYLVMAYQNMIVI